MIKATAAQKEVTEAKREPQIPRMWDWILFAIFLVAVLWIIRTPSFLGRLIGIEIVDDGAGQVLTLWSMAVPGDIVVLVHKAATVVLGAIAGMWCDRSSYPYGRPDRLVDPNEDGKWELAESIVFTGACIRRAIIMAAFMFAFGLAL